MSELYEALANYQQARNVLSLRSVDVHCTAMSVVDGECC